MRRSKECRKDNLKDKQLLHIPSRGALVHAIPGKVAQGSTCNPHSWNSGLNSRGSFGLGSHVHDTHSGA